CGFQDCEELPRLGHCRSSRHRSNNVASEGSQVTTASPPMTASRASLEAVSQVTVSSTSLRTLTRTIVIAPEKVLSTIVPRTRGPSTDSDEGPARKISRSGRTKTDVSAPTAALASAVSLNWRDARSSGREVVAPSTKEAGMKLARPTNVVTKRVAGRK